MLLLIK